jgi:FkbM family methyltransferase
MNIDNGKTKIWIFGSGTFAFKVYQAAVAGGLSISGIIDHNNSKFVLFKDEPVETYELTEDFNLNDMPVYFAICNPYASLSILSQKVKACAGYVSSHSPVELCRLLDVKGQDVQQYWLTSSSDVYRNGASEISLFRELLNDVKSKDLYDQILSYRTDGSLEKSPVGEGVEFQYLPPDLATPPRVLNMVELGSCGGENLESFKEEGFRFQSGYALEPDLQNYEILIKTLHQLKISNLHAIPLAAWNCEEKLQFESHGGTDSSISDAGGDFVQAVSLDNLIPKASPINYIKMDIEGAELKALSGASQIIQTHTPHLAICIYHQPTHLWEIGLWIHHHFKDKYTFHIRTYAEQTFETVLYCIPI